MSHSISLCPHMFTCKRPFPWVTGLVWGLWLLWHHQHRILTGHLLDILLLSCVMKILQLWICRTFVFRDRVLLCNCLALNSWFFCFALSTGVIGIHLWFIKHCSFTCTLMVFFPLNMILLSVFSVLWSLNFTLNTFALSCYLLKIQKTKIPMESKDKRFWII